MSEKINLDAVKKVHLIGIGGIGMSALARFFVQEKKTVTGSDTTSSIVTEGLVELGVSVQFEQVADNITVDTDLFVYTEAMPDDNPELVAARATGKPAINYFTALGLVANPYYLIAVAGTHGKTTTTAMLTDIFEANGKDPTAIIGSLRAKTKSNFRAGKSKYAIVEACEYKRDFLSLTPDVLVITNLEHDHVEYYKTLADVQAAFGELIAQVHETGVVVTNPADPNIAPILEGIHVPVIDYTKHLNPQLKLYAPGVHNLANAAAAIATAVHEKMTPETVFNALEEFTGTWRRFEFKGECNGASVYDDYAHHPTAIKLTLTGMREMFPDKKIIAIFQPHLFSRTKTLFSDFAKAFTVADEVIFAPIYAARQELESGTTSSRELAVKTLEYNPNSQYIETFADIVKTVQAKATDEHVVIIMGAGPVTQVADMLTS